MSVTITESELAVAIRAATDKDAIPATISAVIAFLAPAASAIILNYAEDAPDAVHNAAMIRLAGWLYHADPTDSRMSRALEVSGAAALLARWRPHRAGAIGTSGGGAIPAPPGPAPGNGVPAPPSLGHFILTSDNGVLTWVAFPEPS